MNRKEFFAKSCQCGIATIVGLTLLPESSSAKMTNDSGQTEQLKNKLNFSQERFSQFLQHLENYLDKENRLQLYRKLGESCAGTYEDAIISFKGNLKGMLEEQLKQDWLKDYHFNEDSGELRLVGKPKTECGCPLVKKGLTPIEFCNCSIGHMKRFYEMITDKRIDVNLNGSILLGNEQCSFTVKIS